MNFFQILIPIVELTVSMSSKVAIESISKMVVSRNLSPTKSFAASLGTALASTVVAAVVANSITSRVAEIEKIAELEDPETDENEIEEEEKKPGDDDA